jgi:hypothetical protein
MSAVFSKLAGVLLKQVLGAAVDAFNAWRADQNLKKLGSTSAELHHARAKLEAQKDLRRVGDRSADDAAGRLRDGSF